MRLRPPPSVLMDESKLSIALRSFVDVVFLLLIFFLVTSSFSDREQKLPSAMGSEGPGIASELEPQVVTVRRGLDGSAVFAIGEHASSSRSDLRAVLERLPTEGGVAIRATDDAPVWAVAAAMQEAADAGFEKRSYVPVAKEQP